MNGNEQDKEKPKKKSASRDALEIVGAFVIAYLFYQFLIIVTGTPLPIVSVVSDSMYHTQPFGKWWQDSSNFYGNLDISRNEFLTFQNFNGLSRGDLLLVVKPADLAVGDIVIYQRNGNGVTIVHRIVEADASKVVTKGDNNAAADQPIGRQDVQGKVVFAVPVLGYPRFALHLAGI